MKLTLTGWSLPASAYILIAAAYIGGIIVGAYAMNLYHDRQVDNVLSAYSLEVSEK